jgi:hypothetical protein
LKKRATLQIQQEAYDALCELRKANHGKATHGDITSIAQHYNNMGFNQVDKRCLYYRLQKERKGLVPFAHPVRTVAVDNQMTEVSSVTLENEDASNNISNVSSTIQKGVWPKGSTQKTKKERNRTVEEATTKVAEEYNAVKLQLAMEQMILPPGTFSTIANRIESENKFQLAPSSIKRLYIEYCEVI